MVVRNFFADRQLSRSLYSSRTAGYLDLRSRGHIEKRASSLQLCSSIDGEASLSQCPILLVINCPKTSVCTGQRFESQIKEQKSSTVDSGEVIDALFHQDFVYRTWINEEVQERNRSLVIKQKLEILKGCGKKRSESRLSSWAVYSWAIIPSRALIDGFRLANRENNSKIRDWRSCGFERSTLEIGHLGLGSRKNAGSNTVVPSGQGEQWWSLCESQL